MEKNIVKGIIYLIQPSELVGTNRYKIGCSRQDKVRRCINGYKIGTRYICIMDCINPYNIERIMKKEFNKNFKLIAGKEYFEGEEKNLLKIFIDTIINNNIKQQYQDEIGYKEEKEEECNVEEDNIEEDNIEEEYDNEKEEIEKEFINSEEDEYFGGEKKLIKIIINDDNIIVKYINEDGKIINKNFYIGDDIYLYKYEKELIKEKIIENNKIYDINDKYFIKSLQKYKKKMNIKILKKEEKYFYNIKEMGTYSIEEKIICYLTSNAIINTNFYCDLLEKNYIKSIYERFSLKKAIIKDNYFKGLKIIKILGIKYSDSYLRYYFPYCIEIDNDNKEYYIINRDYQYINIDNKKKLKNSSLEYLYNDTYKPYNLKNIKKLIEKYNILTADKICLNSNEETIKLMSIF
jgi:hypothetical protein